MSRVDKIIDLIDVGLQTPMPDPTYGEVSPVNAESCFRCHRPPEDGSDMCAGCRAFMLGDSEEDPSRPPGPWVWSDVPPSVYISLHASVPSPRHPHEISGAGYARQSVNWRDARENGQAAVRHQHVYIGEPWPDQEAPSMREASARLGVQVREFVEAMDRVSAVFAASGTNLRQVLEEVAEDAEQEATSPRRRHGHAAVCPRHGETRGGTCLRCAR